MAAPFMLRFNTSGGSMTIICIVLVAAVLAAVEDGQAQRQLSDGEVHPLSTSAQHFVLIPHGLVAIDGKLDMFVQLKGSPEGVDRAMRRAGVSAVAIIVTDQGLSRAYSGPFSDPELLQRMIDEALELCRRQDRIPADAEVGRLCIGSFSAGYAAVRELLKHDKWFDRIDGILFLDSIYAGYVSEDDRRPVPEQMEGFRRYARAAAEGTKVMVVTHTRLTPGSYASTYETADDLLSAVGTEAEPVEPPREIAEGLLVYREARKDGFILIGTAGDDGAEHIRHLTHMGLWLAELPLTRPETSSDGQPN
jgi:hypothetical protein